MNENDPSPPRLLDEGEREEFEMRQPELKVSAFTNLCKVPQGSDTIKATAFGSFWEHGADKLDCLKSLPLRRSQRLSHLSVRSDHANRMLRPSHSRWDNGPLGGLRAAKGFDLREQ